jgi:hypothetical protein
MMTMQSSNTFISSSPICVIQATGQQWSGIPEVTYLDGKVRKVAQKSVHFSSNASQEIASDASEEEATETWLTRSEYKQIHTRAKGDIKNFRQYSHESYDAFLALFQECSQEPNFRKLLDTKSAQTVIRYKTPVRGFENRMHSVVVRYRAFHVQGLLAIQEHCRYVSTPSEIREDMLRSRSLHTSRASRSLARILAHGDAMQVANTLQEDLNDGIE